MSRYRLALGLAAIIAVGVSCGDEEAPPAELPNPPGLTALLGEVRAAVSTPPMLSLAALTRPLAAFGVTLATLAGPLQNKTIEWNTTSDLVDTTTRAGAPAGATRVIMYQINPLNLRPIEPLVEVGYVDLFPHSDFPDSSSVRYLVTSTVGGTVVVGDFLAHAHDNATDAAAVDGFVTNGTERLDFAIPYTRAAPYTFMAGNFDLTAPATRVAHRSNLPATSDSLASEITLAFEGDSVLSVSILEVTGGGAISGEQRVYVNDVGFAVAQIAGGGSVQSGPGGRPLTAEESAAVTALGLLSLELALFVEFPALALYGCGC